MLALPTGYRAGLCGRLSLAWKCTDMWTLPEPMLAAPTPDPVLPAGWAAEAKFDGWRALQSWSRGNLVLRSRQGTMLADAFPEVRAVTDPLPDRAAGFPPVGGCRAAWHVEEGWPGEDWVGRLEARRNSPNAAPTAKPSSASFTS
ncbi:hypothetical protein ACBR38_02815 [Streptomyces sp. MAD19A]|uniref:hypothetical protein n=1 Tax=Streptomyces sp. MAD19A TaxID=3242896 RepID=UPI0035277A4B